MKNELRVGFGRVAIFHENKTEDSNIARRLTEEIEPLFNREDEIDVVTFSCTDKCELLSGLSQLESEIAETGPPLIILFFHGCADSGIRVGNTDLPWQICSKYLSKINGRSNNCIIVLAAACYGLHLIEKPDIFSPAPFKVLCAPPEKINNGDVESKISSFFSNLLTGGDVTAAVNSMKPPFEIFIPEYILKKSIMRFIKSLKGRKGDKAREEMITNIIGMSPIDFERAHARTTIKSKVSTIDDKLLNTILGQYLCGMPESFDASDLQ